MASGGEGVVGRSFSDRNGDSGIMVRVSEATLPYQGAPVIYGFVDHQPFAKMYERKSMSDLSPRMLKLMMEIMEYPFKMKYLPGKGAMIGMVDALSRAPHDDASTLCKDPLDLQYHPMHRDQAQVNHEICFVTQALGNQEPCPYDPTLGFMYNAAANNEEYREIVVNVTSGHKWSAYKNKPMHPVRKWGRALFESLSVKQDRQGRPMLFWGGFQAVVPKSCIPQVLEVVDSTHNGLDRACLLAQELLLGGHERRHPEAMCGMPHFHGLL